MGNAGLGWRFLLACMGALVCMGVSLLQSERGVGVSCVAVYICIHNLPRFPRCPNAPASPASVALATSANPQNFCTPRPLALSTSAIKIFINPLGV